MSKVGAGTSVSETPRGVSETEVPAPETVVLDTNVWLALWFFTEPGVGPLREALERGELVPVRSAATDVELAEVLGRPNLFNVATDRQADLLRQWESLAVLVSDIAPAPCRCRDPDDQKFLDLALSAGARWLITRDRDLLKLRKKVRAVGLTITGPTGYPGEKQVPVLRFGKLQHPA